MQIPAVIIHALEIRDGDKMLVSWWAGTIVVQHQKNKNKSGFRAFQPS